MPYTTVLGDIPREITAGNSISWEFALSDYPASSWTLTYSLLNANDQITITGTSSGDSHLVELPAATTAAYNPGVYKWQAYVTNGSERYPVGTGTIEILANFATATELGLDTRTHARKVLDSLEALIEGKASKDQLSYSIAGRSISRLSPGELIEWRDYYKREVAKEIRLEKRKRGKRTGSRILTRFN